ncbi:MAG: hypothetical protein M3Q30_20415 [Actinomycetota bacterium]|nr:hypothetical protein [Actinomycetota bacterium]
MTGSADCPLGTVMRANKTIADEYATASAKINAQPARAAIYNQLLNTLERDTG